MACHRLDTPSLHWLSGNRLPDNRAVIKGIDCKIWEETEWDIFWEDAGKTPGTERGHAGNKLGWGGYVRGGFVWRGLCPRFPCGGDKGGDEETKKPGDTAYQPTCGFDWHLVFRCTGSACNDPTALVLARIHNSHTPHIVLVKLVELSDSESYLADDVEVTYSHI